MKTIFVSAITAALVVVSLLAFNAYAGRSAGGTYTLASPGVPFQSGQVISSTQMNNTFNDIATTLTNSLDRNGNGGMLFALRGIDGTQAAPAFSWTSETSSGWYRAGAGDVRLSLLNSDKLFMGANGFGIGGIADAQAPFKVNSAIGNTNAKFGGSNSVYVISAAPTLGFNSYFNTGFKIGTAGFPGTIQLDGTGNFQFITYPTGLADAAVGGATGTWTMSNAGVFTSSGGNTIGTNGTKLSVLQVKAGNVGCTTGASIGAFCDLTVTWPAAFADTAYKGWCNGYAGTGSGIPILQGSSPLTTTTYNVRTIALTAVAAQFGTIDCFAVHL